MVATKKSNPRKLLKTPSKASDKVPVVEQLISSVSQFIAEIVASAPPNTTVRTFRGHTKTSHLLKPSLYRTIKHMKEEKNILRELISLHPSEFECDRSAFDQLVRMQHFSLETRLLDVSLSPLVALYFATKSNPSDDGHVIIFDVDRRAVKIL